MARNIKAKYHTRSLGKQPVTYQKCTIDDDKNLVSETVTEEKECWLVSFPQGHSIRVTDRKELERMGYHLRPRMVDMETGDVVNIGGDPYDFANNDAQVVVMEDEELTPRRTKTANA